MKLHICLRLALVLVVISAAAVHGHVTPAVAAAATSSESAAGVPGGVEEIRRLEQEYNEAYKRGDADALDRLHTGDFSMTARGRVTERNEMLARMRDQTRPRGSIESLTENDVRVRDYGQTVVTTGRWKRVSKDATGTDTSAEGHFTRVWVRQGGHWRLAVAHYSPVARPPAQTTVSAGGAPAAKPSTSQ